jgi:outer membrane protein W
MNPRFSLILTALLLVVALAPQASGAERAQSYMALKGGIYSSSASFDIKNINVENTFGADTKSGFDGELAIGHYVLPTLALELGIGYFKGTGSLHTTPDHDLDFNVVPVILSAKALIPAGPVDPYGELGLGAYFTSMDVQGNANSFSGNTTFGLHAGAGLNINFSSAVFVGAEARYVWADPSFGDQKINLNGDDYALDGFDLNGFTTTLVLGYGF